jgi:hypothetical protein
MVLSRFKRVLTAGGYEVHIGNDNVNTGFYLIEDMVFSNATNTSIRIMPRTASTQVRAEPDIHRVDP